MLGKHREPQHPCYVRRAPCSCSEVPTETNLFVFLQPSHPNSSGWWSCFFLLSPLTCCLFLMTHFWETCPRNYNQGLHSQATKKPAASCTHEPGRGPQLGPGPLTVTVPSPSPLHPSTAPFWLPWQRPGELGPGLLFLPYTPPPHPLCFSTSVDPAVGDVLKH